MSREYDLYLHGHRACVKKAFEFIRDMIPSLIPEGQELALTQQICFNHDRSKNNDDEYEPYDEYFYGKNRAYQVIQDYEYAWLLHIHRNPHHWQYWILNHDDPDESETVLDMPDNYILEMICDWWSFSWKSENLYEIFAWYDKNGPYMKISDKTRKKVEFILERIRKVLDKLDNNDDIEHSGVKGMKWGVKNGPPYPIDRSEKESNIVTQSIRDGEVKTEINIDKQKRHTKLDHIPGRSYINGGCKYAQELVDKHCGKGEAILDRKGKWTNKERFIDDEIIGVHIDTNGAETSTKRGVIAYSKTGSHVYPA